MSHPLLQLLFFLGLGIYIIQFARSTYTRPDVMRQRWFHQLPDRKWSLILLRCIAVFWLFGGFILICHGLTVLPLISDHRGAKLVIAITTVAVAATALVLVTTPRRNLNVR